MYTLSAPLPRTNVKTKEDVYTGIHIPGKVQSGGGLTNRLSGQYSGKIRLLELSHIISVIGRAINHE
jgi:hypothetical protein